jgi:hypothetical protein
MNIESSLTEYWNMLHQSSHTEGFLLVVTMEGLYYWFQNQLININKLESGEEQHHSLLRTVFIKQNGNFEKQQELKGHSEKFKNPFLILVMA